MANFKANPEDLLKRGVYKILNSITGEYYIGSTIMTFLKRMQPVNINKSCKTGKPYKGLTFSYKPLYQETDIVKLDKNGEV